MPSRLKRAVHLHIQKKNLSLSFVMQTVEATAASQDFVYKANLTSVEQYVPSIEGYVVLLPTILSVMYGQGEWPEESVSTLYGDHLACSSARIDYVLCMLSVSHIGRSYSYALQSSRCLSDSAAQCVGQVILSTHESLHAICLQPLL